MKMQVKSSVWVIMLGSSVAWNACAPASGNHPGSEYMMDMGHSIAYESNTSNYYSYNRWGTEEEYHQYAQPRLPQHGTIPRGYAGLQNPADETQMQQFVSDNQGRPVNGHVPYYYADTEEDRARASREITMNPFPITEGGLARGKQLYDIYCGICHGEKADGSGYLVRDDGGVYPAQPANMINEEFTLASNGRLYHAIMYGKNVMGGYSDKLSYEERWQVIHYLRSLQAKEFKKEYSAGANTLNTGAVPSQKVVPVSAVSTEGK